MTISRTCYKIYDSLGGIKYINCLKLLILLVLFPSVLVGQTIPERAVCQMSDVLIFDDELGVDISPEAAEEYAEPYDVLVWDGMIIQVLDEIVVWNFDQDGRFTVSTEDETLVVKRLSETSFIVSSTYIYREVPSMSGWKSTLSCPVSD